MRGEGRCGIAIGDCIFDLKGAAERGLIRPPAAAAVTGKTLDAVCSLGPSGLRALRHDVFAVLDAVKGVRDESLVHRASDCTLHLPTSVRSFTDFFAGIHHAVRCGEIIGRPEDPLPANYHHLPIGYNGRASTVIASGGTVSRPHGLRKRLGDTEASFGASRWLDFELEMGFFIGSGNQRGEAIPIQEAADQIVGFCLLNDWSSRDIQLFDMVPVGPLNSKSFCTTISPWIVTMDAMAPFRASAMERTLHAPPLADYLDDPVDRHAGGIDVALTATISTERMQTSELLPVRLLNTNARHLYCKHPANPS